MTDRREMHANLMHPAGVGFHAYQRCSHVVPVRGIESRKHRDMADRVARRMRSHRHPLALHGMAPDGTLDRQPIARDFTLDDREIDFPDAAFLELPRKRSARKWRAC